MTERPANGSTARVEDSSLDPARWDTDSEEIFRLIKSGTGDDLKASLKRLGYTVKCIDEVHTREDDLSVLQVACSHGNASTADALLELGMSPLGREPVVVDTGDAHPYYDHYTKVREAETCMHLAVRAGSTDVMELLIKRGLGYLVNTTTRNEEKISPLMAAATRYSKLYRIQTYEQEPGKLIKFVENSPSQFSVSYIP